MATGTINSNADPLKWKQLFDAALDELSGDTQRDRNRPIYQRKAVVNEVEPEYKRTDRALTTAADALAALWKMPAGKPTLRATSERSPK